MFVYSGADLSTYTEQGGHAPGKPGKVGEFHIGQGKVREIVVCL